MFMTSYFLSRHHSKSIVDVVMRPKFGNFSIPMRQVIISSILYNLTSKANLFEACSWFEFTNLGLALGMALKFYIVVTRGLKLKVRKIWGLITIPVEDRRGKRVWGTFMLPYPK